MAKKHRNQGVMLPEGYTGSSFFRKILEQATSAFPEAFKNYELPQQKAFKKYYAEAVVRFEATRVGSEQRSEIAKYMVQSTQEQLRYLGNGFDGLFNDYMAQEVKAASFETIDLKNKLGLKSEVSFRGKRYKGAALKDLAQLLRSEHKITNKTAGAMNYMAELAKSQSEGLDLSGKKFVVLGASAELAPTSLLLAAGATVLWIDVQEPSKFLDKHKNLAGKIVYAKDASDILMQPKKIKASIEAFADGDPVDICMFAYAAGASQEWRLAATMNGIIRSLKEDIVRSVSMLISPTSAAVMQEEDLDCAKSGFAKPPIWQKALQALGQLKTEVQFDGGNAKVARAIVPLQGLSYQAAQYISKTLAAEVYATQGVNLQSAAKPIIVSANVAGITKTRSLEHPIFQAAFIGAPTFGVEIFEVTCTQALSGLLLIHDLINEEQIAAQDLSQLFAQQVHGGIYSRAFALDPMIRIATIMGLARKPQLLLKLF
mgnify:CR=1 FL=1